MRTYAGHSSAAAEQRAVPAQPRQGPDRPVGRLRPADPDRLRPRPRARPRRGRQGRRPDHPPRRHARAVRRHPAGRDEHLDDDQRDRDVAAGALPGGRRGAGPPRTGRGDARPGTTQNDIIKEYLSRGTYVFPPGPSLRLITDMVAYTVDGDARSGTRSTSAATTCRRPGRRRCRRSPTRCAPRSPCSTPCATRGQVPAERFGEVVARISFFVNAGVRFVEEMCKMRAFVAAVGRAHPRALRRHRRRSSGASATACRSTRSA